MLHIDARIPVVLDDHPGTLGTDATLEEGGVTGGTRAGFDVSLGHAAGCTCCATRSNAGRALAALLHDRARGKTVFFKRVVAIPHTPAGRAELLDALRNDPVGSACFRLSE